jgi:hypothetical protein
MSLTKLSLGGNNWGALCRSMSPNFNVPNDMHSNNLYIIPAQGEFGK